MSLRSVGRVVHAGLRVVAVALVLAIAALGLEDGEGSARPVARPSCPSPGGCSLASRAQAHNLYPAPVIWTKKRFANCAAFSRYIHEMKALDQELADTDVTWPTTTIVDGRPSHMIWIAEFDTTVEIHMPWWVLKHGTAAQRKAVGVLQEALRIHEQGHALIAQRYRDQYPTRGDAVDQFSEALDTQFRAQWYLRLMLIEVRYDKLTHHGGTQHRASGVELDEVRLPGGPDVYWPGCPKH